MEVIKEDFTLQVSIYDCIGCGDCVSRCRRNVLRPVDNGPCGYAVIARNGLFPGIDRRRAGSGFAGIAGRAADCFRTHGVGRFLL